MKLYSCSNCDNYLYFENTTCLHCNKPVGFDSQQLSLLTLQKNTGNTYTDTQSKTVYRYCRNASYQNCNWLIPADSTDTFCKACSLNRTIPSLAIKENKERWDKIEIAKHRMIYTLLQLNVPIQPKTDDSSEGLAFDFMADISAEEKIMTGHNMGLITLNIAEADEVERTKSKLNLKEKYRTLLGHFRHEIGHYYWDVLIKNSAHLNAFREIFGDETMDYDQALENYYNTAPQENWEDAFISVYATSHPWEDWAETWAHYMHVMDSLETAYYIGIGVRNAQSENAKGSDHSKMRALLAANPFTVSDFNQLFNMWLPLTFAVNNLNRSMGYADFYPFVISEKIVKKLSFIHDVCKVNRHVS